MIGARAGKSGGGQARSLQAFIKRSINAEPAGVVEGASRVRITISKCRLNMINAKIAPLRARRKWYADHLARKIPGNIQNDRPRLGFERSWSQVVPFGFTAAQRAIPHAKSPKAV